MPVYSNQPCNSSVKKVFTTKASVASWSRPMTNDSLFGHQIYGDDNTVTYDNPLQELSNVKLWTHSRPIKHWRKQLIPAGVSGKSPSSMSIQDRPAANSIIANDCCSDEPGNLIQYEIVKSPFSVASHLDTLRGKDRRNICQACDPDDPILVNTSGIKDAKVQQFNFDTKSYLRSRNKSFISNQTGSMKSDTTYSTKSPSGCCNVPIPYSDNIITGTQNRSSFVSPPQSDDECKNKPVNIIVKPNNQQFFQQGAVSSSSRIERLKYNTVTANASGFSSAWGAAAANAGKYRANGTGPYFIKSKVNKCTISDYRKHWRSIGC